MVRTRPRSVVEAKRDVNPLLGPPHEGRRLYGVHAVGAWLDAAPAHLRALRYDAGAGDRVATLVARARAAGVAVHPLSAETLAQLVGTRRHQGVVADAHPFPYVPIERLLAQHPRLLVVADQLQDPHNLGALVRSAEAVGAQGLVLPKQHSVPVTASVEAVAAGATAFLPICRVPNVHRALGLLKENGLWVVGLSLHGRVSLFDVDLPERTVVLVGGEGGIRPLVERACDLLVAIPMQGRVQSLNASVAAAVALFEVRRRWARALTGNEG